MEIVDQREDRFRRRLDVDLALTLKVSGFVAARISTAAMASARMTAMTAMISNMVGSVVEMDASIDAGEQQMQAADHAARLAWRR